MKKLLCLLFLFTAFAFSQTRITPDCVIPFNFTATASTSNLTCGTPNGSPNSPGIASWIVVYESTGFSAVSLVVQSAADNAGAPGTYGTFAGTVLSSSQYLGSSGINPNTATTSAVTGFAGYYPWMRVTLASITGTGRVKGNLYGFLNSTLAKAGGAGGGAPTGPCGGDLGGTYPNCTVVNLSNVVNGSLANSGLANSSTTVNGVTCTLGAGCTVGAAPTGTAGGDLSGTYPNPTVAKVNGNTPGGTCGAGAFANVISTSAVPTCATPTNVPGGTAGGDLSGTYPNPTVAKVDGVAYPAAPSTNTVPVVTGSNTVTYEKVPNAAIANPATTVNGQTCTLGSTCTVTGGPTGTAGGDLSGSYPNPTVAKVDGVAYPATPSTNTVPVVTASNTVTYEALPNAALANPATTVNGQTCTLGSTCTVTGGPTGTAGGDLSGSYPNPTVAKVNGNTPGGTCGAGQFANVISTSAVPTCATPASSPVSGTINDVITIGASNLPADSGIPNVPACGGIGFCLTGTLSSAQILTSFSAPITLLPAAGAGTVNYVDFAAFELIAGGTVYTSAAGASTLRYTNGSGLVAIGAQCSGTAGFLASAVNAICNAGVFATTGTPASGLINQPIVFITALANPLLGTGTINYWIRYRIKTGF